MEEDFNTLDKSYLFTLNDIFTLNVSATQELQRKTEEQKNEINDLQKKKY